MATFTPKPTLKMSITIEISEEEARAINEMTCYGTDQFIKAFYENLGKSYMEKHERGLRSFLDSARAQIGGIVSQITEARKIFTGEMKAVPAVVSQDN